jgi:predicted ATPase/DNA-binding SARP family transcriptional activator
MPVINQMENQMSESRDLKIYTLGDFRIQRGGEPFDALRSRKAQALLVYLASTSKSHSREVLADFFWSESSQTRAMSNLRDVIHALKTYLEPFVDITRYSIALNPESRIWIDIAELEIALSSIQDGGGTVSTKTANELETALKLYQKDFLEGFYLRGATGFEEWQLIERERIRLAALDGYNALIQFQLEGGNYKKGINYARRALALEPLMEVGHQQLMRLLALSGRSSEALVHYETCKQILEKELGVEPSEETKGLYESLLKGEKMPGALVRQPRHNLPLPLSKLIGRDEELTQIVQQLSETNCRLLTLIGVGGIGKTRLGLQAAAMAIDQYPDGVWLVELAAFNEEELLPDEIAAVFGVSAQEARSGIGVTDILIDFLKDKTLLLVLDNCEHLIEACASFSDNLLNGCPNVKIMATSRESLGIYQENIFSVSPLSLPPPESPLEGIENYPAIQLFIERAANAQPGFHLEKDNSAVLTDICWHLEGIPLAIELAAARVRVISLDQIARRLQDRFRLLTGGPRTALPRHQTLQATMDWSYGLLPQLERALLRQLSVFSGGWTLKAAEEVAGKKDIPKQEVLDLLSNLVDKSLVLVEDRGTKVRYRMLETVRQYGLRMLSEEGELEEARQRHADYFVLLAEQADEGLRDARQAEAVEVLDSEHDNLRGALRWATNSSKKNLALRLVGALGLYWFMRGHWKESWRWFHQTNDLEASCDPIIRAKAICRAGGLQIIRGNLIGTVELVEEAVDICREFGDEEGLAWSLSLMGNSKTWADKDFDQAMPYLSESVERFKGIDNDWGVAFTLPFVGQVLEFQDEYEQSVKVQKEGIAIFERLGDKWNQSCSLYLLGNSAIRFDDIHLAEWAYEQSLMMSSSIKDKVMHAHALKGLGQLAFQKDDREQMETINLEALEALQKIGDENCTASVLRCLGEVSQRKGDYAKASELLGQSLHIYQKLGLADNIVFLLDRFAALGAASGKKARAVQLLGASSHLEGERGMLYPVQYKDERKDLTNSLREMLGEGDFEKLFQEGASMSLEDAVSYALRNTTEE